MSTHQGPTHRDRGAALPLVIMMTVLLALAITATSMLTQTTAAANRVQTVQRQQRAELVNWALQSAIRDLSPASGRMLGVDPAIDPAGSCAQRLGPYTTPDGRIVRVDCTQGTNSGWASTLSSLVLVGDGSGCAGTGCITGKDGGLLITSNDALNFSGTLINLSGAWLGKNANSKILNPMSNFASVLQPESNKFCPALVMSNGNYVFNADIRCQCPPFSGTSGVCYAHDFQELAADIATYRQTQGNLIATYSPAGAATIPSCSSAARWDPNDTTSPYAVLLTGGIVGQTELAKLNALTDGKSACVGDGTTKQAPILVITGALRFQDTTVGSSMLPGQAPLAGSNIWTINAASATIVMGAPKMDAAKTSVIDCRLDRAGGMLQFAGSTYLRLTAGRMLLCPIDRNGAIIAAPGASDSAGFMWDGVRTEPLLSTQYGLSSGEVLIVHGLAYSPAAFFKIDAQSNRTVVSLGAGTVLRALTLNSNPSTSTQGDFLAPSPIATGTRRVQLRFWDVTRGRDLGIVQVAISGTYPDNPAAAYAFSVWRTMW